MRKLCRLWKREEGVAILEMVMIMPVIAMIIFLIMDMGLFFFDYVSAQNAAREGARCGAVGYSDASVEARVIEAAGFSDPHERRCDARWRRRRHRRFGGL